MTTPTSHDLKDEVLHKIRTGDVHMKPKSYFALKIILLAFVAALVVIVAAWLVSFIIFSLNISERSTLLGFGWRGIQTFLWLFPWRLLLVEVILIALLGRLTRHFRFSYRSPMLYSLVGGMALSGILALVMNSGAVQEALLQQHHQSNLPLIGSMYERVERPERPDDRPEVIRGVIMNMEQNKLVVKNADEETVLINVLLPESAFLGPAFMIGDEVFVAGDLVGDTLQAYGIKKVTHFRPIWPRP